MDTSYIGQLVSGVFYLLVGAGLLRLAQRTAEAPERLLGIYFLFTGLDYSVYTVAVAFEIDAIYDPAAATARVAYAIAVVALMLFTRRVFRSSEGWARFVTWLCPLAMFAGVAGSMAVGSWDGGEADSLWYWPYFLGFTIACCWVAWEAAIALAAARRRQRIGLCERIVVNRYLLWFAFGSFQVAASVALFFAETAPQEAMSRSLDALLGVLELASIAAVWLAFFAPVAYRNWISGAAASRAS